MDLGKINAMNGPANSKPVCEVAYLGEVDYQEAWNLQNRLAEEIGRGLRPPRLLLLEHPPTYTFGRQGNPDNLLWDEAELIRRGIQVFWVDRGGDVTYHGPGQLVGYPILPLGEAGTSNDENRASPPRVNYIGYLRRLEAVLVKALGELEVKAYTLEGLTGVWVNKFIAGQTGNTVKAKIASIGVKVDARGVSRHGFALNVKPDMTHWDGIVACGLLDSQVTSLDALLEEAISMEAVRSLVSTAFGEVFGYDLEWV
jgi:lipoyl(octanoyl) transferase